MRHPFEKLYSDALRDSARGEDRVLEVVLELKGKGYPREEIYRTIKNFYDSLIQDEDIEIVRPALDEADSWMG